MSRVDACRVIALMQYPQTFWDCPAINFPRNAMSLPNLRFLPLDGHCHFSVSVGIESAFPFPTRAEFLANNQSILIDMLPIALDHVSYGYERMMMRWYKLARHPAHITELADALPADGR